MTDLKTFRRQWSAYQKKLRVLLSSGKHLQDAKDLFYSQHMVLHSSAVSNIKAWSYADEIFRGLTHDQIRIMLKNQEHSLAWILWHISRIEDVTMNILVADGVQVFIQGDWENKLSTPIRHTGNNSRDTDVKDLSQNIDIEGLFNYRDCVGKETRKIVSDLSMEELDPMVSRSRLDRILGEGAVLPESEGLIEYWGKRKIFQLLLMPPTRHLLVHLNEALAIKKNLSK